MKTTFSTFIIAVLILFATLFSCNTTTESADNTDYNTDSLRIAEEQEEARRDSIEMEDYRNRSLISIETNEKRLQELKKELKTEKKELRADTQKKIDELELETADLKSRLKSYRSEGKEKWKTFKSDFDAEMDSLGQKIKDIDFKKED